MIVVDASVWIDYFRKVTTPQTDLLDGLFGNEPVAIADLVLVEVLQGFTSDRQMERARDLLALCEYLPVCNATVAHEAVRNYRSLRVRGITIRKTIDTLIATRCILDGLPLLYSDRDFDPFVAHLGLRSAAADLSGVP